MKSNGVWNYMRIVWTIALKDIIDAIKNKTTISIIVGIGLLLLSAQALPLLMKLSSVQTVVVYHPGTSRLIGELADSREYHLIRVPTQEALENAVAEAGDVQLGLVLPENVDTLISSGRLPELQGYYAYWAKPTEVEKIRAFFESKFGEIIGVPLQIDLDNPPVYPGVDADGQPFMISLSLAVAVIIIGTFLVPYLIMEEKEKHTLEALMLSPASYGQVVLGKAIAGLTYCLTAAAVVMIINISLISQWWVVILGTLAGALFAVSIGLLFGTIFDHPGSMNLWLGMVLIVLMLPIMIVQIVSLNLPTIIMDLIPFLPSIAMTSVIRMSFSDQVLPDQLLQNLGIMVVAAVLLLSLVVWSVRRLDRR